MEADIRQRPHNRVRAYPIKAIRVRLRLLEGSAILPLRHQHHAEPPRHVVAGESAAQSACLWLRRTPNQVMPQTNTIPVPTSGAMIEPAICCQSGYTISAVLNHSSL